MTKGVAGAVLIAAVVIGAGMTAPAFAARGGHGGGGYSSTSSSGYSGYSGNSGYSSGNSYPPGWSHGQKRGWGGRGMPPGLYRHYNSNYNRGYSGSYGY